MTRYDLPFGPLDARTDADALPSPFEGSGALRLAEASGVVPSPVPGAGYLVPDAASVPPPEHK